MKIQLQQEGLLRNVALIHGVIETRKTLPILSHLLFEVTGGELSIFGTDLDVGIKCWGEADVFEGGAVALPAKKLHEIVKELPPKTVTIEVDTNHRTNIRCEATEVQLRALPKEDFPLPPPIQGGAELVAEGGALHAALRRTLLAVSQDPTRYTLNSILLQSRGGGVCVVATDGHRLAVADLPSRVVKWEGEALIPRKAATEIFRLLRGGEVTLHLTSSHTLVLFDKAQLNARLIEGQFPNYQQVVPTSTTKHASVGTATLSGALRRTSAILGERTAPTTLHLRDRQMVVSCVNAEVGEAREHVPVEYTSEGVSIGFNARYILDFLSVVEEEEVEIHFNDALSPVLFRPKGNESYKCVIMPMRI